MTISKAADAIEPVSNVANVQGAAAQVIVTMLEKAQDQVKQQGEALIKIIEQTPNGSDGHLDLQA